MNMVRVGHRMLSLGLALVVSTSLRAGDTFVINAIDSTTTYIPERIMAEAYSELGIPIKIVKLPAARSLHSSNKGLADAELARVRVNPVEYPNLEIVPVVIDTIEGAVFTKVVHFDVAGWESLRPYKIGIRLGIKFTEKGTKGMNVVVINNNAQLVRMLDLGRLDIVVMNRNNALYEIERFDLREIKELSPPVHYKEVFHYLHKKNTHLIPKLTAILGKMKSSGRMEQIARQARAEILPNNN